MNAQKLARLPLFTGYVFENGSPYYEKLGDERAAALLKALSAEGYCIVSEEDELTTLQSEMRIAFLDRLGCKIRKQALE
jgi:hypothetical protein